MKLAILISGSGRTLKNFIDVIAAGKLDATIAVVVSSAAGVKGVDIAREAGIPVQIVEPSRPSFSDEISAVADRHGVDLILLAGFIRFYRIPERYEGKVLNIHPALLPKYGGKGFYGHHVHEAVLKAGEKESGCTVHYADNVYDHGSIVLQRRVPIAPDETPETLAEKVFREECIAYPEAVRIIARR